MAEVGQPHAPRIAMKERRADEVLELLDAAGDDGTRHAHLSRGLGEALRFGDTHERIDGEKAVHGQAGRSGAG